MTTLEEIGKKFEYPIKRKPSSLYTTELQMRRYQNIMERLWVDLEQQKEEKGQYSLQLSPMDMLYVQEAIGYASDLIEAILIINEEEQNA